MPVKHYLDGPWEKTAACVNPHSLELEFGHLNQGG